jgi:hypothetical protein
MRGLFVAGPWHGTIRELPEDTGWRIHLPRLTGPTARPFDPAEPSESVAYRVDQYMRQQLATPEPDGGLITSVWTFNNLSPESPEGYRVLADALHRVVIRSGLIDYRHVIDEEKAWRHRRQAPEVQWPTALPERGA